MRRFHSLSAVCFLTLSPLLHAQRPDRQQAPPIPPSVEAKLDLPYAGTDNPRQRLDLYLPKDRPAGKKLPVLVFVHGGAWQAGDKTQGRGQVIRPVAEGKCAGISLGYRLSGEATWPAQIHDCKAALRWIKAHAKDYNLDPNCIVVQGSSAGGHLVAVLGTSAGVPEMDGTLGPDASQNTKVAGVIDFFGPTDVSQMDAQRLPGGQKHDSADSPESRLLGAPVQTVPDKVKSANPLTYVDSTDPPFLIVHGDKDALVPHGQSEILVEALKKAALRELAGGKSRGFGRVPCFAQFPDYQARRSGTGKIRHNSLRSAFGTYSGFPWPSALSLMGRSVWFHAVKCPSEGLSTATVRVPSCYALIGTPRQFPLRQKSRRAP